MKPPVSFARTTDGGHVAFTDVGNRYPLIDFPISPNVNVALEWDVPKYAATFREFGLAFRYIRFEARGLANSSDAPIDRKLAEFVVDDIDAVAKALSLTNFALMTYGAYGEIALRYAVTHPETVTHVVINNPMTHDQPWTSEEARRSKDETLRQEAAVRGVDTATRAAETHIGRDGDGESIDALARVLRRNETAKTEALWEKVWQFHHELDLAPYAPHVRARVLITSNTPYFDPAARELAAMLPNASLALGEQSVIHTSITQNERRSIAQRLARFIEGPEGGDSVLAHDTDWAATGDDDGLSPREREVLVLLAAGKTTAEVAGELVISATTVARHIANIYAKLGVRNRAEAAAYALRHHIRS